MRISFTRAAVAAAVSVAALATAVPAQAGTGCNGVVDWFKWGCAGWDNNNGPQFPYYRKRQQPVKAGTPAMIKDGVAFAQVNGNWAPVVASGGGNVVASGGGNVIAPGGANVWMPQ